MRHSGADAIGFMVSLPFDHICELANDFTSKTDKGGAPL